MILQKFTTKMIIHSNLANSYHHMVAIWWVFSGCQHEGVAHAFILKDLMRKWEILIGIIHFFMNECNIQDNWQPFKILKSKFFGTESGTKNLVERDFVTLMSNNGPGQNFYRKKSRKKNHYCSLCRLKCK